MILAEGKHQYKNRLWCKIRDEVWEAVYEYSKKHAHDAAVSENAKAIALKVANAVVDYIDWTEEIDPPEKSAYRDENALKIGELQYRFAAVNATALREYAKKAGDKATQWAIVVDLIQDELARREEADNADKSTHPAAGG